MKTLLQKARESGNKRSSKMTFTAQDVELVKGYFRGEVNISQMYRVLHPGTNNKDVNVRSPLVYPFIARCYRYATINKLV